jgi:ubiquinone/menaquinone biosynthesis C-methylase UbiE
MRSAFVKIQNQWDDFVIRKFDIYAYSKYKILIEWMGPLRGQRILVVGSGSGEFACMLAKRGACVEAMDISPEAISLTERTALEFGVDLKTHISYIESFKSDGQYDWVVATDVIEHILGDKEAVRKMESLVRVGGKLLLTVPSMQLLFGHHDEILGHYRRYSRRALLSLIDKSFDIRNVRYFGFFFIPVAFAMSRVLRKSYPVQSVGLASASNSFLGKIINLLLDIERKIKFPLGTSLLLTAEKTIE